ncbi:hypothetical protein B9G98_01418 [Wickerhamiella sorbophila]|uniref:BHLH domain-containing protein n=1 Tax=Wickerhamiella sorbophila TaxID=45607 RepID=A0A2T0FFN3_9ASCO|nr:hypothetical protein B9G98_01418 [Wickerhamiella sorbophila]PRT53798.1 hypothetical protein B9G98_01418 [Wickerhamiella sorbophila]
MGFEELPEHLPVHLSTDMMENMFDLPDPRFSISVSEIAGKDQDGVSEERDASRLGPSNNSSPQRSEVEHQTQGTVGISSVGQIRQISDVGLHRVQSSNESQRSTSISSAYEPTRARHNSIYSEDDNGVHPNLFYSPAIGPHNIDGTPLMSPRDAAYAGVEMYGDFSIPPAYVESPVVSPSLNPQKRKIVAAGRVAKKSPQLRARMRRSSLVNASISSTKSPSHSSSDKGEEDLSDLIMPPVADAQSIPSVLAGTAVTPATLMGIQFSDDRLGTSYSSENQDLTPHQAVSGSGSGILHTHSQSSVLNSRSSSVQPSPATTPLLAPAIQQRKTRVRPLSSSSARQPRLRSAPISPAILPNDQQGEQDMASLLASKSNIQSIMEGVHQQMGLKYSEDMTSELSSKKKNHKMAEQERRNRMNSALVELSRLVAMSSTQLSKAATVEAAIEYIKRAQSRIAELEEKLAGYEHEL